jgi:hypothetical protein
MSLAPSISQLHREMDGTLMGLNEELHALPSLGVRSWNAFRFGARVIIGALVLY